MSKTISISTQHTENNFTKMYEQYRKPVLQFAMQFWKDESTAEDVAQDVFMKLWENQDALSEIDNFRGYLFMMVRNKAYSHHHRNQNRRRLRSEMMRDQTYLTTHDALMEKEYKKVLQTAVSRLSAQRKKVYVLNFELGWNRDKIASILDISPKTVKHHLQIAREIVREYVSEMVA